MRDEPLATQQFTTVSVDYLNESKDDKSIPILQAEFRSRWGAELRQRRKAAQMSLDSLAQSSGLHPSMVSRLERGDAAISDHHIVALGVALGLAPAALVPGAPSEAEAALLQAVRSGETERALHLLADLLNTTVNGLTGRQANPSHGKLPPSELAGVGQASVALAAQIAQTITDNPAEAAQLVTDWVGTTR